MKTKTHFSLPFITGMLICGLLFSCSDIDISEETEGIIPTEKLTTRAVPTYSFDWENIDWMPTPPSQTRIPSPWVGAGSIASLHGLDVVNDRKKIDGWELLYSSFDPNTTGQLINPYFILYNKYRGLMRIFFYTTTQFLSPSSYLQDNLRVISKNKTSLFNFIGEEVVDGSLRLDHYSQVQSAPDDGTYPLASNKWYMVQYELAYDPDLAQIPYNQVQLSWNLNYCNIENVSLGGDLVGKIIGTIGSSSSPDFLSELGNVGKTAATGVLAGIGSNFISKNTINEETGENKLKVPNKVFKALGTGLNAAISAASGNYPGAVIGLLNGIIGGSSGSAPIPANFFLNATIKMEGSNTNNGSFPSMPITFWMPGTNIASDASGYIPLYNKSLGIFNFNEKPTINVQYSIVAKTKIPDPWNNEMLEYTMHRLVMPTNPNFSNFLIINPDITNYANISIKEDLVVFGNKSQSEPYVKNNETEIDINPKYLEWTTVYPRPELHDMTDYREPTFNYAVRFTIEINPKNGAPKTVIYKTFKLDAKVN